MPHSFIPFAFVCLTLPACTTPASSAGSSVTSAATPAAAKPAPRVAPQGGAVGGGDLYAQLVARAESGDETVDWGALRRAYLKSPAFDRARGAADRLLELRKAMFAAMAAHDHAAVLARARESLDLVYIDLEAQKARAQACAVMKDTECEKRGRRIELGLLRSIISSGDGLSCASAWQVVTVDEEYFILRMSNDEWHRQTLVQERDKICDKMDVTDEAGQPQTHYFDVGALLAADEARISRH